MTNVILDTCALLWLAAGDRHLSPKAKLAIAEAPLAFVSVVSGFEIALKHRRGKLQLPARPEEWFETILAHHGLALLALNLSDAIRAPQLPDIHGDPCDRFIIAAALRLALPIVTTDAAFESYGVTLIK